MDPVCVFWLQTRNLLRIAIFNISYIRGLFPEKYFNDKSVPALGKLIFTNRFLQFLSVPIGATIHLIMNSIC